MHMMAFSASCVRGRHAVVQQPTEALTRRWTARHIKHGTNHNLVSVFGLVLSLNLVAVILLIVCRNKKVLILGSGGLQIGQAGEFDYSGKPSATAKNTRIPPRRTIPFLDLDADFPPLTLLLLVNRLAGHQGSEGGGLRDHPYQLEHRHRADC